MAQAARSLSQVRSERSSLHVLVPAAPRLEVVLVQDGAGFSALQAEWEELYAHVTDARLAQSYLWLRTWWEVFQQGRQLALVLVRDSGRLVGIAPLLQRCVRHRGMLPLRRLELLASGEPEADEIDSDYLGFLLRAGYEEAVTERLARYLTSELPISWDELVLPWLSMDSATYVLSKAHFPAQKLPVAEEQRKDGVIVPLPETWEEYLRSINKKRRHNLVRERKLVEGAGKVQFAWTNTAATFEALWPNFIELHQQRWEAAGQRGCFASPQFLRFHRRVGPVLAAQGQARLAGLWLNDRPVAMRYLFVQNGRVYGYQSGVDPHVDRKLAVGKVLAAHCIQAAIEEGLHCYDFLKGVTQHKLALSSTLGTQASLRFCRPGVRTALRGAIEAGVGLVKRSRPRD